MVVGLMKVWDLKRLLEAYKDDFDIVIKDNYLKVTGQYYNDHYEEYINSAGGTWEGGCGNAPNGKFCGECSTFDCDKCDWKERE
jgi:hypothetical protein